jgi:hypothetical protein
MPSTMLEWSLAALVAPLLSLALAGCSAGGDPSQQPGGEVLVSTAPDARSARASSGDFPTAVKPTKLIHVARLRRLASWLRRSLLPQDTSCTSS